MPPWLLWTLLGGAAIGAVAVVSSPSSANAQQAPTAWPPNAATQQQILTTALAQYQAAMGSPATAAYQAQLQAAIAAAPAQYVATLSGQAPTIAAYVAWATAHIAQATGGGPVGITPPVTSPNVVPVVMPDTRVRRHHGHHLPATSENVALHHRHATAGAKGWPPNVWLPHSGTTPSPAEWHTPTPVFADFDGHLFTRDYP